MNLPEWPEGEEKLERGEELTPLELLVYEHEDPCDGQHGQLWRERVVAAIRHVTALPKSCGECPIKKCNILYGSVFCKAKHFDHINNGITVKEKLMREAL